MLVTFGEPVLRYTPPAGERLETADRYDAHVGGPEATAAVVATRLGVGAVWASRLLDSRLGRRVVHTLRGHGVEPAVTWSEDGRVSTCHSEAEVPPRPASRLYERDGAAAHAATASELAVDRVRDASALHLSAVTPALSDSLSEATAELVEAAATADTSVSLDLDYRPELWEPSTARSALAELCERVDVLLIGKDDAGTVFDRDGDPFEMAAGLASDLGVGTVVVRRGATGAVAYDDGTVGEQSVIEGETVDAFGASGAYAGGYLAATLRGGDVSDALKYAGATAALARTVRGDLPTVTADEVDALASQRAG
jgi:2-dehydro-3-deoxygluconokinase